jgi:hypothetical protein
MPPKNQKKSAETLLRRNRLLKLTKALGSAPVKLVRRPVPGTAPKTRLPATLGRPVPELAGKTRLPGTLSRPAPLPGARPTQSPQGQTGVRPPLAAGSSRPPASLQGRKLGPAKPRRIALRKFPTGRN